MAMNLRLIIPSVLAFLLLGACSANVEATKQKLLASGNEYFDKGQFREAAIMYGRALSQDRRFGEAYFRLAQAQIRLGRFAQAARALHRASELQPENSEAFSQLAEIYLSALEADPLRRDRYIRELEDILELAGQRGTDNFQLLRVRGYLALAKGEADVAVGYYQQAIAVNPEDQNVPLALMRALRKAGKLEEAESLAKKQIEKYPDSGLMYDRLYTVYVMQEEMGKAEEVIEAKCEAIPESSSCQLELAAHYHVVNNARRRDELLESLAGKGAGDPALLASIGDFYERIQEYQQALRYYRMAQEASPERANFYRLRLAEILATAGRGGDALQEVAAVLEDEPDNAAAIALRGAIRLYDGDRASVQDAINDMEEVIAELPRNAVLRYNLGVAYLSIRDMDKAQVQFQEAAALLPTYQAPRYQLGRIYLRRNQPAMSAQLADEILQLNPTSLRGRLLRAEASIWLQEYNQARAYLDSVMTESPENADARFLQASLHMAEHRYAEAESVLRRLYEDSPSDPRGIRGLVGVYVVQGKEGAALDMLDTELEKSPDNRQLRLFSAQVAMSAANYDRAVADYGRLLEIDPEQSSVHVSIGVAYHGSGDLESAERHFRQAVEAQPRNVTANLRLSMLVGELGRFDESHEILQNILKVTPENPVALNNMAYILSESPQTLDTAQTMAQRAVNRLIERDPRQSRIRDTISETLAYIYMKKNLHDSAIEIYEQIVPRNQGNARWRYRYAMALFQKGDLPKARHELQRALATNPPKKQADQIRQLLSQAGG